VRERADERSRQADQDERAAALAQLAADVAGRELRAAGRPAQVRDAAGERARAVVEPGGELGVLLALGREPLGGDADLGDDRRDLLRRRLLLLRGQDRLVEHAARPVHEPHHRRDLLRALVGREDRLGRLLLDPLDDAADRVARGPRALGEPAHLGGDDGEAAAGLAGAGGLDRGVQGEHVRRLGDLVDQRQDLADPVRALAEVERALPDRLDGLLHLAHRVGGLLGGGRDVVGVVRDRRGAAGEVLHRRRRLRHGGRLLCRCCRGLRAGAPHLRGGVAEHAGPLLQRVDDAREGGPDDEQDTDVAGHGGRQDDERDHLHGTRSAGRVRAEGEHREEPGQRGEHRHAVQAGLLSGRRRRHGVAKRHEVLIGTPGQRLRAGYAGVVGTRYDDAIDRLRAAAQPDRPTPEAMRSYAETVRRHAFRVTDADVSELLAQGLSEDEVFEQTVSVAVAAGLARLEAGLRAAG
jgi:hypothetical protein